MSKHFALLTTNKLHFHGGSFRSASNCLFGFFKRKDLCQILLNVKISILKELNCTWKRPTSRADDLKPIANNPLKLMLICHCHLQFVDHEWGSIESLAVCASGFEHLKKKHRKEENKM